MASPSPASVTQPDPAAYCGTAATPSTCCRNCRKRCVVSGPVRLADKTRRRKPGSSCCGTSAGVVWGSLLGSRCWGGAGACFGSAWLGGGAIGAAIGGGGGPRRVAGVTWTSLTPNPDPWAGVASSPPAGPRGRPPCSLMMESRSDVTRHTVSFGDGDESCGCHAPTRVRRAMSIVGPVAPRAPRAPRAPWGLAPPPPPVAPCCTRTGPRPCPGRARRLAGPPLRSPPALRLRPGDGRVLAAAA